MSQLSHSSISNLPEFQELLRKRRAITVPLLILTLVSYYLFIILVAYAKDFLSQPVGDSVVTVGILYGFGVILLTLVITGVYVWYANTRLDHLIHAIEKKAGGQ